MAREVEAMREGTDRDPEIEVEAMREGKDRDPEIEAEIATTERKRAIETDQDQ